ncbi:hypothetical protein PspLS_04961 [Pyricularia sp. CBS 133598]|nr:hypothetical protein PspLS_04961 [Pyricularia sp. CBS 133598]
MLCNVRLAQYIDILEQHPRNIKGYVALADNDSLVALGEVRVQTSMLRQAVVPADELTCRVDTLLVFTRNPKRPVLDSAIGKDNGVIVAQESRQGDCCTSVFGDAETSLNLS